MLTTELGACEWFVWDLRRSNLIDRGQLEQVVGEYMHAHPNAEPQDLADHLIAAGVLTRFQADRLLQGKTQGFVLGPFTLMDSLGVGSMGTVYKAVSKTDGKWYAVKVLPRRSMWNVRIARRKVRAFEAVQHPAVVPFVDVGTSGGMHYLAWPYVEGRTLEAIVKQQGKLSAELTGYYGLKMAEGLEASHVHGLFHGLFKPSNVMITPDGDLCILDFGIGCLLAETEGESLVDTMSTANSVASGLDCASPESIMDPSNLNALGDQYSLGCVLYFCLTGQYPFPEGTAAEKMMAHQLKQPTPIQELNPDAPDELVQIVEWLMQKAPEKRFPSTADVVEALRPWGERTPEDLPIVEGPRRRDASQVETRGNLGAPRAAAATRRDFSAPDRLPAVAAEAKNEAAPLPDRRMFAEPSNEESEDFESEERVIPGAFDDNDGTGWEERLATIGVIIGAIVAGVLAWLLVSQIIG